MVTGESVGRKKKNVWFDICHTPQYNFYKNFIIRLAGEGHIVYLTILNRGKMPLIIQKELAIYSTIKIYIIGRHRLAKWSAIIDANLIRIVKLFLWSLDKQIDIAYSNAFLSSAIGKVRGFHSYTFDDDPQTLDFKPKMWFSKISHYCLYELPSGYTLSSKVKVLPVLKEWAYLAPNVFVPDMKFLDKYKLKPKEYFFVREVSVGTVNYAGQSAGAVMDIASKIPHDKKVLLSLEDKSKKYMYPKDWILLEEPVEGIHSLIYYSCALISSGDSMAREAALLGVPSYYLGIRYDMPANRTASRLGILYSRKSMDFEEWIDHFKEKQDYAKEQKRTRDSINHLFIDINEYMYSFVDKLENNNGFHS